MGIFFQKSMYQIVSSGRVPLNRHPSSSWLGSWLRTVDSSIVLGVVSVILGEGLTTIANRITNNTVCRKQCGKPITSVRREGLCPETRQYNSRTLPFWAVYFISFSKLLMNFSKLRCQANFRKMAFTRFSRKLVKYRIKKDIIYISGGVSK